MIDIHDLTYELPGGRKLCDALTWRVDKGQKVGLMGRNGEGKTTLLRLILGALEPDSGSITLAPKGAKLGYLPQDLAELPENTPLMTYLKEASGFAQLEAQLQKALARAASGDEKDLEALSALQEAYERADGYHFESSAFKTLAGLGFKPGDGTKLCGQFSGGWRMRISLAVLLLSNPDILLLDEPTNHLDTESMEWLERRLASMDATMVVISHDRAFMDKIVTAVGHLQRGKITVFSGNYSSYLNSKAQWEENLRRENEAKLEQVAHLQSFVDRFRYKASKARQAQMRLKQIDKIEIDDIDVDEQNKFILQWPACTPPGRWVVKTEGLSKSYDHQVFADVNIELLKGQKIALLGYNGSGKSTLSRLLAGVEEPTSGTVSWGHNVHKAYFAQDALDNLRPGLRVWDQVTDLRPEWVEGQRRGLLGRFGFGDEDLNKPLSVLSGGEKSRLALARLTMTPSNFLILDEPTNHLDAHTKELFERAVLDYPGTLIIVSHDRSFLNRLVTGVWYIADGKLTTYEGDYAAFRAKREAQLALEGVDRPKVKATPTKEDKRRAAESRNQLHAKLKPYKARLQGLEERIEAKEEEKEGLEAQLCDPGAVEDMQTLQKRYATLSAELEEDYAQWEALTEEIETIEQAHRAEGESS